jgi:hypothetical protein
MRIQDVHHGEESGLSYLPIAIALSTVLIPEIQSTPVGMHPSEGLRLKPPPS